MVRLFYLSLLLPIQLFCKNVPDSLQTMDLQHKNLTKLPDDFSYANIRSLLLGYNPIKVLPLELVGAKNLTTLNMDYNSQFDFETSIHTIKQLKLESLSINNSNLMYLPLEISEMKGLHELSLACNYIKEIPEYIFLHTNLYSLNVGGNLIKNLPKEIASQQNLRILDLSKNPCINEKATYKALLALKNLTELSVKGASVLPATLWDLKTLQRINISDGTFSELELPKEAGKHNLTHFTAENCDNLDFANLMPLLSSASLKEITIGGGQFNGFANAAVSPNVARLTISGTQLNHFSFSSPLTSLEELRLNFSSITCQTEMINTLGKLSNLKNLDLSNCDFNVLPSQVSNLRKLENLNLSGNKLSSITELLSMKQLATLDVSLCGLSPEQIETLKKELPNTTIICYQEHGKLPLENARVATEKFAIDPANPQTIVTQNGTTITIPKNSLVYSNGKPVKETVTINYTPYYSLADISVAGINMNYKTKDEEAPFASAGMFNINASVNGKNVELKKGAEIKVAFKSNDAGQSYNYYAYDTIQRTWTQTGKDSITTLKVAKPLVIDTASIMSNFWLNRSDIKMPQPPAFYRYHPITIEWDLENNKKLTGEFTIDTYFPNTKTANDTAISANYFNELRPLTTVTWKMDAEKASPVIKAFMSDNKLGVTNSEYRRFKLKPRYYTTTTRTDKLVEFDLIADKEHDNFIFRFYDDVDTVSFSAYPVVQTRNTARAQNSIRKIFFKYKGQAEPRKKITEYKRQRFVRAYNVYKAEMAKVRNEVIAKNQNNITSLLNSKVKTNAYDITRVLSLQGFGIYNCDRTVQMENPLVISPVFYNENGKRITQTEYQIIDPKENIVVSYFGKNTVRVSKNSVVTFMTNSYSGTDRKVLIGKLNTFDLKNGKAEVVLTKVSPNATLAELNDMINSIR